MATLVRYGFPVEAHNAIIEEINESLSSSAHLPIAGVREIDERDDLEELQVRLEDVLDSVDAMSIKTRCRVLGALKSMGAPSAPPEKFLRQMRLAVGKALSIIPGDSVTRSGRPKYNDARETRVLACLLTAWFAQFRRDRGVVRRGDYAESNLQEYEGRLLDFVVMMFKALGIVNAGSPAAIGKRIFQKSYRNSDGSKTSLQDRIRSRFPMLTE